jgi:hypothetical protein
VEGVVRGNGRGGDAGRVGSASGSRMGSIWTRWRMRAVIGSSAVAALRAVETRSREAISRLPGRLARSSSPHSDSGRDPRRGFRLRKRSKPIPSTQRLIGREGVKFARRSTWVVLARVGSRYPLFVFLDPFSVALVACKSLFPALVSFHFYKREKSLCCSRDCGYVGNAKRCPSPVVNPKGFPSGRHIHSLVVATNT